MLSILFFIQVNISSSVAKEQFDKMAQLFIAKKPPFSSEIQPGAHSI